MLREEQLGLSNPLGYRWCWGLSLLVTEVTVSYARHPAGGSTGNVQSVDKVYVKYAEEMCVWHREQSAFSGCGGFVYYCLVKSTAIYLIARKYLFVLQ